MAKRVLAPERRQRLVRLLADEGRVVASEAAARLGVSLDTVRRDLDELAAAGAVHRVHGGALPGRATRGTRPAVGPEAVAPLRAIRADLCILGACSLHPDAGVTVLHREGAIVGRVMLGRAARVAVLAAAGKLGSGGPYVVGP